MVIQKEIILPQKKRGIHPIGNYIYEALDDIPEKGMVNIFLKHTSAGLMINENADPDVLHDLEKFFDKLVPENITYFKHIMEGPDDMPAHIKSVIMTNSLNIPISNFKMNLGTWQGIYLCEFRNYGGGRKLVVTITY